MFARKLVLTSCLAIAASMLAGCASYKNESGLPKWLDDASEANRLGYFMGISLKDSPAPEGFAPSKNTLVSDLRKLFKNPCSQAELNKIVPFGFSLQRQKMVFFCHQNSIILLC